MKPTLTRLILLALVACAVAAGIGLGLGKERPAAAPEKAAQSPATAGTIS